jgi:hypothetical protein
MASFSDKQLLQLKNIVVEVVSPLITQLETKINDISKKVDKIEDRLTKLEKKVDNIEIKLTKLETSFQGYIKKEGDIYEIKVNDTMSRYLNHSQIQFSELHIGKFYSLKNEITDFDGLFLINFNISNQNAKRNNSEIILIEAKHDLDKSKIDQKLLQYFEIEEILKLNNTTKGNDNYNTMILNDNYKLLKKNYKDNLYLYFAADNVTKYLEDYILYIFDGTLDKEKYIELTNLILNTHDLKLIEKVIKLGKLAVDKIEDPILKDYIINFKTTFEYINSFNFKDKPKITEIKEYYEIMKYLKTFTIEYDNLKFNTFKNKVGLISNNIIRQGHIIRYNTL